MLLDTGDIGSTGSVRTSTGWTAKSGVWAYKKEMYYYTWRLLLEPIKYETSWKTNYITHR